MLGYVVLPAKYHEHLCSSPTVYSLDILYQDQRGLLGIRCTECVHPLRSENLLYIVDMQYIVLSFTAMTPPLLIRSSCNQESLARSALLTCSPKLPAAPCTLFTPSATFEAAKAPDSPN